LIANSYEDELDEDKPDVDELDDTGTLVLPEVDVYDLAELRADIGESLFI
jgi:hypothetical protein